MELGFEKPMSMNGEHNGWQFMPTPAYSIGELIEILDGKVTLEIDNYGGIWLVSTPIFDFIGAELIDCLFDACVKLKEEGVI